MSSKASVDDPLKEGADTAPAKSTDDTVTSNTDQKTGSASAIKKTGRWVAPLNTPLKRRRQTFAVLISLLVPYFGSIFLSIYLIRSSGIILYAFLAYIAYMYLAQEYSFNGGHCSQWFRSLGWWKHYAGYFPLHLHKTVDLDPSGNYIFGYHPHGILSVGAFGNFATNATGFDKLFPGIDLRVLTLRMNFYIPFLGLYLTALGLCDASRASCNAILQKGPGHSLLLVLGGAKESLQSEPGTYRLTLKNRKGFVKIALRQGASLVPVMSFGETDLYDQVDNKPGSPLRKLQNAMQQRLGFAMPLIMGRGVFNYVFGLMPHRRPIHTVVGAPIQLPKTAEPTGEQISRYHALYCSKLEELFDEWKDVYARNRRGSLTFEQ